MEKNEIKKALYKQNPKAWFTHAYKDGLLYRTDIQTEDVEVKRIAFVIPFNEIGDAVFTKEMPAKLLIRYLI